MPAHAFAKFVIVFGLVADPAIAEAWHPLIAIDFDIEGVTLTDPEDGQVLQALAGKRLAWFKEAGPAVLGLDQDGDLLLTEEREVFLTLAPTATNFNSLSQYDHNHDFTIDAKDPVFQKLVLWYDINLNGRCDRGETVRLTKSAVVAIHLEQDLLNLVDLTTNIVHSQARVSLKDDSIRPLFELKLSTP